MVRVVGIAVSLGVLSCTGDGDGDGGPPADTDAPPTAICTELTYQNFGQGFIHTWCLPCHTAELDEGDPRRQCAQPNVNFDTYAEVFALRTVIDRKVSGEVGGPPPETGGCSGQPIAPDCVCVEQSDMQMPPAGGVSEEDAALLHEWVACDAPGDPVPPPDCFTKSEHPGPVSLATQADADAFCAGTANHIAGDLAISGSVSVDCLCSVDGAVAISGAAADVSLPLLTSAGALSAVGAVALDRISAPNLRTLAMGDLELSADPALSTLDLPWLTDVAGSARLTDLAGLTDLPLGHLANLGGDLTVSGISAVTADLTRVRLVGGTLSVTDNAFLHDIDSLKSVYSIGGDLSVTGNPVLDSLRIGDVLEVIGGDILVSGNPSITEINGFTLLPTANAVTVSDNDALESFDGFDLVLDVAAITVSDNANLSRVDAFRNVGAQPGYLATVVPDVVVARNPRLGFLSNFCATMPVANSVLILGNGLGAIAQFDVLEQVVGDVTISENPELDQINGLPELRFVGGSLTVDGNGTLASLTGLGRLEQVGGNFAITDNPVLPTLQAQALVDQVGAVNIGGTITVSGNQP